METYCCSALAGTHVEAPTLTEVAAPRELGDRIPPIDFVLIYAVPVLFGNADVRLDKTKFSPSSPI